MTIRWALAGPGRHAERSVIPGFKRAKSAALAAVVSRDAARGNAVAERHRIPKTYTRFEEMLRDAEIDAVYDATPDGLHAGHIAAAASSGKHILVEKPLAISVAAAAEALAAARRAGVTLGVVFNQRHEAVHVEARRLVAAGAIGEVVLAKVQIPLRVQPASQPAPRGWRADPAFRPGGIGWSIGDHAFDTLAYLAGLEIDEVAAFTDATRHDPPDERTAGLLLRLANGAIGYAAASSKTPFGQAPFELHGTKGSILVENSYTYLAGAGADPRPRLTLATAEGTVVRHFAGSDCFRLEIERFTRAIEGKAAPMTSGDEGLRAVAIGEAALAAARTGQVAKVADFLP
ncbi:MAG: Gfo/Idh/MocA family protein [Stellaceae bacterium]